MGPICASLSPFIMATCRCIGAQLRSPILLFDQGRSGRQLLHIDSLRACSCCLSTWYADINSTCQLIECSLDSQASFNRQPPFVGSWAITSAPAKLNVCSFSFICTHTWEHCCSTWQPVRAHGLWFRSVSQSCQSNCTGNCCSWFDRPRMNYRLSTEVLLGVLFLPTGSLLGVCTTLTSWVASIHAAASDTPLIYGSVTHATTVDI